MQFDLSFYLDPPELTEQGRLKIWSLSPLSMVSQQPGTYFRTELTPTQAMLYGMIENAAGWHFHKDLRRKLIQGLTKIARKKLTKDNTWKDHSWLKAKPITSGSGYISLLQFHLKFTETKSEQTTLTWDDLWSMLNRSDGISYIGGSRNYDFRLDDLITKSRGDSPTITFGDRRGFEHFKLDELRELAEGKVHVKSLSSNFPQFYSSPRKRGYIEASEPWVFEVATTRKVSQIISQSLTKPSAPLYLGTNDGWIYAKWESYE
ncbi:MAG: hypothetical protein AAF789_10880 [Bacteroidota bacterium]